MVRLIGAGWGRTGTASIKEALDSLGFRSHHMREVFDHPEHADLFLEASADPSFDWERIYSGYEATVDWPGCTFWRELAAFYSDAPVLLSVRDPADWYDSYRATIHRPVTGGFPPDGSGTWNTMVQEVIIRRSFGGEPHDRDYLLRRFNQHVEEVTGSIPASRLCIYRVTEGWGPLCALLGVEPPDEPFPHANERGSWGRRFNS